MSYTPRNLPRAWKILRAVSANSDAGPLVADLRYDPAAGLMVNITDGRPSGGTLIRFRGTGATGTTAVWALTLAKEVGEAEEFVAAGTCTIGAQPTGNANEFFCHDVTITASSWPTVSAQPGVFYTIGTGLVANCGIGKVSLDNKDYKAARIYMSNTTTTTIGADIGSYGQQVTN